MKRSGSLRSYVITRVLLAIPMLLILLTVVFLLMRVAPGDPITAALGGRVSTEELARRRHDAGYDRPLPIQYVEYLKGVVTSEPRHDDPRQPADDARSSRRTAPPRWS